VVLDLSVPIIIIQIYHLIHRNPLPGDNSNERSSSENTFVKPPRDKYPNGGFCVVRVSKITVDI
jgi:hypothetical protein